MPGSKMDTDSVREGYDRWAVVYDHDANPLQALEGPIVRKAVGDAAGLDVLDLGCGTGRHAIGLAQSGATVTAIDFSARMLDTARQKPGAERVRFLVHDLHEALPFGADFDLVISGLVLEHLNDLDPFFREVNRVLRPSGRAVVSSIHPAMFLRGSRARFTDPETGESVQPGSIPHPLGDCMMSAVRAGLRLIDVTEQAPDSEFAREFPRAEKYIDWPMLVVFELAK